MLLVVSSVYEWKFQSLQIRPAQTNKQTHTHTHTHTQRAKAKLNTKIVSEILIDQCITQAGRKEMRPLYRMALPVPPPPKL